MKREPKNVPASIQARLLQRSRDLSVEHQLTLARFGGERLLYRFSKSEFTDRFILKGAALLLVYPGLLDLPRARVRVYRPETSIAEKTEAMVRLALANSRMKDFFDIDSLAAAMSFDGDPLRLALAATFQRRQTALPTVLPIGLTSEFGSDSQKRRQWEAFVRRTRRTDRLDFSEVIETLREFLWPVLQAAASTSGWHRVWCAGGPWTET